MGKGIKKKLRDYFRSNEDILISHIAKELLAVELNEGRLDTPLSGDRAKSLPRVLLVGPYRSEIGEREIASFLAPPLGVSSLCGRSRAIG